MTDAKEHDAQDVAGKLRAYLNNAEGREEILETIEVAASLLWQHNALRIRAEAAERYAAELNTLIRRTDRTNRVRAERQVRTLIAEQAQFAALRQDDSIAAQLQLAEQRTRAARVSERPMDCLGVGVITQREQDLIELAAAFVLNAPALKEWTEAFQVSAQQPVEPAGGA